MYPRLRRFLLPTAILCAFACTAPTAAIARLQVGVSDNGFQFFTDPMFQRLHAPVARLTVPWDAAIMRNPTLRAQIHTWLAWAKMDHVQPLVSFGGESGNAGNFIPSARLYTSAVKKFMHDFPTVNNYTAWNEPDWIYRPPLARHPGLAAAYFNALARYCHHCTVAAGDVYLPGRQLGGWLRAYRRGLHSRPKAWAIHPYDDVRSHTTSQLRTLMRQTSGSVWLDEISGVERRGHWGFRNQSPIGANNDERFLFSLPRRFHRITRIYHYQWLAVQADGWDSGLIGPQGRPRPAYYTFANAVHGRLPR